MTITNADLHELLDAIRAGGDIDVVRRGVELMLQALIDAEATARIGAERFERTEHADDPAQRDPDRLLSTKAGDVELKIPKLRQGSFFPSILERRRRIDRALFAVVMEAYVHGVSTRKVDDLVVALGLESGISKSEVSRICAELDERAVGLPVPIPRPRRVPLRVLGRHLSEGPGRPPGGLPGRGGGDGGLDGRQSRGARLCRR